MAVRYFPDLFFSQDWNFKEFQSEDIHEYAAFKFVLAHHLAGFYLGFLFGGKVGPKSNFGATQRREKHF